MFKKILKIEMLPARLAGAAARRTRWAPSSDRHDGRLRLTGSSPQAAAGRAALAAATESLRELGPAAAARTDSDSERPATGPAP